MSQWTCKQSQEMIEKLSEHGTSPPTTDDEQKAQLYAAHREHCVSCHTEYEDLVLVEDD